MKIWVFLSIPYQVINSIDFDYLVSPILGFGQSVSLRWGYSYYDDGGWSTRK